MSDAGTGDGGAPGDGARDYNSFGSVHTRTKLEAIQRYLTAYNLALSKQHFVRHYVDAFAGTGMCDIDVAGEQMRIPGSASIAVDCLPPFHQLTFIEKKAMRAAALRRFMASAPNRRVSVIQGDANTALPQCLSTLSPERDRALVVLDPFGMQVEWATLAKIARTELCDLWYLFPLSAVYRQAARRADAMDQSKVAALTRIFGSFDWRGAFYERPRIEDMFAAQADVRNVGSAEILKAFKGCLETIFPGVAPPKVLHQIRPDGQRGAPIFALFFAVSNPRPAARALALRLAESILKL